MVKYGKTFRKSQIKGWEDKYFNYKKLKQKIKEIGYEKEQKNLNDLNEIEKNEIINKWIKEFTEVLDKEIRTIYIFFSKNEKKLYKDINIYLHIKEDYESYDLEDYLKQYQELKKLSYLSLNISKYVYYNLKALLKILKKFDKKIIGPKDKDNQIKNNLIITKLEEQNSDILYLINFKMIDEVNVILEDLIACLNKQFKLHKNEFKTSVVEYLESDNTKEEKLINEQKVNKIDINQAINIMEENHKKIKLNIKNVDMVSLEISKLFLPWKEFLRISGDVSSRLIQLSKELNSFGDSTGDGAIFRNNRSIVDTITFSKQNSFNIYITFYHAFLYMFCFSVIIPTYPDLISSKNILTLDDSEEKKYFYFGLLMMMAPLGSIVSYLYESRLFAYTTKIPFMISSFGLIIGNILYYLAGYFNIFSLLFIGRLLIGIFNLRTHNKMYIINFLLKKDVSFYLTLFHTFSMLGLGAGFLINLWLITLSKDNLLVNRYTFGSFLCAIFSFILFILSLTFFTEARSSNFNITSMRSFISDPSKSFISTNSVNGDNNNSKNINSDNTHNLSNLIFEESANEEYSEDLKNKTVMVNDINAQLGDFNRMSKYNDTNMVSLSISALAYKEREKLSSLLSSFIVYLIIIFTTKFINETIFINLPIFIMEYNDKKENKDVGLWVIPFVFGISCLFVLFIEFMLRNKHKLISEKNFLIILFFLNLLNDLIMIFLKKKYTLGYFIIISLAIILCNNIEKYSTHFFYSIIPQDYIVCKIQGNIFINVFSMLAKVISSVLVIGFCKNYDKYDLIIYLCVFSLSMICLILFLIFYSDIRVKSISRIMNKIGKNEVKIATEV